MLSQPCVHAVDVFAAQNTAPQFLFAAPQWWVNKVYTVVLMRKTQNAYSLLPIVTNMCLRFDFVKVLAEF